MRRNVVILALTWWLSIAAARAQPPAAQPGASARQPARPTLVVFLTIDQLRPDYFDRYGKQLTGGLGRLLRGGAVFLNGYQDHAITETAPGHASTLSGRFPRSTGIVRNSVGVQDPQAPLIDAPGPGASPLRFRGGTLVDWLRFADARTRALSVSRKDRGAILPVGRGHQDVYWYAENGRFTTSTYYYDTLPTWVRRFNERRVPQSFAGREWRLLLPESAYSEPDSVPVESQGVDFTFPHVLPADTALAARLFPNFPWSDGLTLELATTGLRELKLGAGPQTDVLAISLSATDAVGHRYGPDSRELHDQILRLDRSLGAFFDTLFSLRDSTRVAIALTSDHGVASFPQLYAARERKPAHQVSVFEIEARYRAALAARGVDSAAFAFEDGVLFVHRAAFGAVNADSVVRAFAADLRRIPGVLRVDAVASLAQRDTTRDDITRRWIHALPPDLPAELVITLAPQSSWRSAVAMHGSPHDYDARVPIIFYGAAFKPGRYSTVARVVDMAPTLAHVTGVRVTEPIDGRVLTQALR